MLIRVKADRVFEAESFEDAMSKFVMSVRINGSDAISKTSRELTDNYCHDMGEFWMVSYSSLWSDLNKIVKRIEL